MVGKDSGAKNPGKTRREKREEERRNRHRIQLQVQQKTTHKIVRAVLHVEKLAGNMGEKSRVSVEKRMNHDIHKMHNT